jgi:hypothetical protein
MNGFDVLFEKALNKLQEVWPSPEAGDKIRV